MKDISKEEYERKKKAIFDAMSKRGQARILKIGYENWDPFQEPKDPREKIFSTSSLEASAALEKFYRESENRETTFSYHKELFELLKGFIDGDNKSRAIFSLCEWYLKHYGKKNN